MLSLDSKRLFDDGGPRLGRFIMKLRLNDLSLEHAYSPHTTRSTSNTRINEVDNPANKRELQLALQSIKNSATPTPLLIT